MAPGTLVDSKSSSISDSDPNSSVIRTDFLGLVLALAPNSVVSRIIGAGNVGTFIKEEISTPVNGLGPSLVPLVVVLVRGVDVTLALGGNVFLS